jgi:hypothetical protein
MAIDAVTSTVSLLAPMNVDEPRSTHRYEQLGNSWLVDADTDPEPDVDTVATTPSINRPRQVTSSSTGCPATGPAGSTRLNVDPNASVDVVPTVDEPEATSIDHAAPNNVAVRPGLIWPLRSL